MWHLFVLSSNQLTNVKELYFTYTFLYKNCQYSCSIEKDIKRITNQSDMLNSEIIKKIEDFVLQKPRSINEIAEVLHKNWRTADRYIEEIEKNLGTIATRTFRGGTRGALKIVFWSSTEKVNHSVFQEKLEKEILTARRKEDFSAFDIFQHVKDEYKRTYLQEEENNPREMEELFSMLNNAQKQVLILSGNLSFLNLKYKNKTLLQVLEELVKRKIPVKVLCRVDIIGKANLERLLSLNYKEGTEYVEVAHKDHPLRAFIVDNKMFRIKEIKEPTGKIGELDKKVFIYYTIRDKEWSEWLSKIFWKMFSNSIKAQRRLEEMNKILK